MAAKIPLNPKRQRTRAEFTEDKLWDLINSMHDIYVEELVKRCQWITYQVLNQEHTIFINKVLVRTEFFTHNYLYYRTEEVQLTGRYLS